MMKALIRNKGETVTEASGLELIDWKTGYPLTDPKWFGGPYKLVENYIEMSDGAIYDVSTYPEPEEEEEPVIEENEDDYVVIDGKRYSKEELRRLIE